MQIEIIIDSIQRRITITQDAIEENHVREDMERVRKYIPDNEWELFVSFMRQLGRGKNLGENESPTKLNQKKGKN